jgi:hypothetical protein
MLLEPRIGRMEVRRMGAARATREPHEERLHRQTLDARKGRKIRPNRLMVLRLGRCTYKKRNATTTLVTAERYGLPVVPLQTAFHRSSARLTTNEDSAHGNNVRSSHLGWVGKSGLQNAIPQGTTVTDPPQGTSIDCSLPALPTWTTCCPQLTRTGVGVSPTTNPST